jgi:lipopolysaccharide exporter
MPADTLHIQSAIHATLARLRRSIFVRNVFVVMSGTAIAQTIGFALSPIISRLFSPEDFGVFGSFCSVSGIIAAGVTLEYSQAIMLPKDRVDAFHLFLVACLAMTAVTLVCLFGCLIAPGSMNSLMKTDGAWALALLVVATFTSGLNSTCQAWCVRAKGFKQTSTSQVVRSVSSNSLQIGFGVMKVGAPGLIISNVLADLIASLNLFQVVRRDLQTLRHLLRWQRMKQLAKEYGDFPAYSAPQNVINALSSGLPVLLLTHYYGIHTGGAYAFGMRILSVPMGFFLRPLRQVLFQKASETQHDGKPLGPLYVKATLGLFAIAALPTLLLAIWAPQVFTWIFGDQWHVAGEYSQWLVLWMLFAFCNLPAILFARLIRVQRMVLIFDMTLLAVRSLTLILGGNYFTAGQTIIAFSLVGAAMNFILISLIAYAITKLEGSISLNQIFKN